MVTNTRFWEGLPADIRAELEKILAEVTDKVNKIALKRAEDDRQKVIDSGRTQVLQLSKEELAQWRQVMKPVWRKFQRQVGKDTIQAAIASNNAR